MREMKLIWNFKEWDLIPILSKDKRRKYKSFSFLFLKIEIYKNK